MVIVCVVPGFGQKTSKLIESLKLIYPQNIEYFPLNWMATKGSHAVLDKIDYRDGKKVLTDMAQELIEITDHARIKKENLLVISFFEGSRIIENVFSKIKGIDQIELKITHLMISPLINPDNWNSVSKISSMGALLGVTGVTFMKSGTKSKIATLTAGLVAGAYILKNKNVTRVLQIQNDKHLSGFGFVEIKREIIISLEHDSEEFNNLKSSTIYLGNYSIEDTGEITKQSLVQKYRYKSRFSEKTINKKQILTNLK